MSVALIDPTLDTPNPLDLVEQLANQSDWPFERASDEELAVSVSGSWCDYHLSITWRPDLDGMHVACAFDLRVPMDKRREICVLLALINEQLWLGHFDLWSEEGVLVYRNGLVIGGATVTEGQCADLIHQAVESCERYYPCFQFVIWAGQSAAEAVRAAMFETVGEA